MYVLGGVRVCVIVFTKDPQEGPGRCGKVRRSFLHLGLFHKYFQMCSVRSQFYLKRLTEQLCRKSEVFQPDGLVASF